MTFQLSNFHFQLQPPLCDVRRIMLLCAVAFAPPATPYGASIHSEHGCGLYLLTLSYEGQSAQNNEVIAHHEGLL